MSNSRSHFCSRSQIVTLKFFYFFFLCTFAAIPLAGRSALSRMKPVASSWLWSRMGGIGSASIVAFMCLFKQRRQIPCAVQHPRDLNAVIQWAIEDDVATNGKAAQAGR